MGKINFGFILVYKNVFFFLARKFKWFYSLMTKNVILSLRRKIVRFRDKKSPRYVWKIYSPKAVDRWQHPTFNKERNPRNATLLKSKESIESFFDSKTFLKIIFRWFEFKQIFWTKLFFHSNLSNRIQMTNIWSNKYHHQNYINKIKIILHRTISVVWITNFLSEIRSLSNHDDET